MQLALTGRRRELSTPTTGLVSWYEDAPTTATASMRPLVLIHSINAAGSACEVKPIYDHYRRERPVIALDLPGFGLSERTQRAYTPRLMTDAIHAVVSHIRNERSVATVDAIALSLSCEFLARAASEAPAQYRSLGLISPTGFNRKRLREGPPGSNLGRPAIHALISSPVLGPKLFGLLTRRAVIQYFLRRTWGSADIDDGLLDYDYLITHVPGAEHAPLQFLTGFLFSGDSGTLYRGLGAPVWVVHGVRGDFVNYEGLCTFADRTNWKIESLPTGALPHFEMIAEFSRRYDAWSAGLG